MAAMSDRFTAKCLVADGLRAVLGEPEMAAVHQHVGRHQKLGAGLDVARSRNRRRCPAWSSGLDSKPSRWRIQSIRANSPSVRFLPCDYGLIDLRCTTKRKNGTFMLRYSPCVRRPETLLRPAPSPVRATVPAWSIAWSRLIGPGQIEK